MSEVYRGWTLDFEAPARSRILGRDYMWVTVDWNEGTLWWDHSAREWITDEVRRERRTCCSSSAPCRSYKAFKRHLGRHEKTLRGRTVFLPLRWVGHEITARPISVPARKGE